MPAQRDGLGTVAGGILKNNDPVLKAVQVDGTSKIVHSWNARFESRNASLLANAKRRKKAEPADVGAHVRHVESRSQQLPERIRLQWLVIVDQATKRDVLISQIDPNLHAAIEDFRNNPFRNMADYLLLRGELLRLRAPTKHVCVAPDDLVTCQHASRSRSDPCRSEAHRRAQEDQKTSHISPELFVRSHRRST